MSMEKFQPGQSTENVIEVSKDMTINRMGREGADVLSTPALLALMEHTCIKAEVPYMPEGYTAVGYAVDGLRHLAPTPIGRKVRVRVELTEVDRNRLTYSIEAFDGETKIGICTHKRAVISTAPDAYRPCPGGPMMHSELSGITHLGNGQDDSPERTIRSSVMSDVRVRLLQDRDVESVASAFRQIGSNTKPASLYQCYLSEQKKGQRTVLVAFAGNLFAGYLTIRWRSDYPPFQQQKIPEIKDFNVLPGFRRRGIGTMLMDEAEERIGERSPVAGIGVGMSSDYGAAHRLYVVRGYLPDGQGLFQKNRHVRYGDEVTVDDDLVIYFTKKLD